MPSYVKILFLTMYFIGVFIKTRQLFLKTTPPCRGVCVRACVSNGVEP